MGSFIAWVVKIILFLGATERIIKHVKDSTFLTLFLFILEGQKITRNLKKNERNRNHNDHDRKALTNNDNGICGTKSTRD